MPIKYIECCGYDMTNCKKCVCVLGILLQYPRNNPTSKKLKQVVETKGRELKNKTQTQTLRICIHVTWNKSIARLP